MNDVNNSWSRIESWLQINAPKVAQRLAPPATVADIARVESEQGLSLPPDLKAWWSKSNGVTDGPQFLADILPGGFVPVSTHGSIRRFRTHMEISNSNFEANKNDFNPATEMAAATAGTTLEGEWIHLPSWIIISGGPDTLFVDCREGASTGCVMKKHRDGGQVGPLWPSVSRMLPELADILESIDPSEAPLVVEYSFGEWDIPAEWFN